MVKQAEEDGRIIGYMVLTINRYRPEYPVGFIVDLLTLPDRSDAANALVDDAILYFDENDVNIVNYMVVKGHLYEKILKRHGFLDSRIKIYLFYLASGMEDEIDELERSPSSEVHFSYGDIDSLPVSM